MGGSPPPPPKQEPVKVPELKMPHIPPAPKPIPPPPPPTETGTEAADAARDTQNQERRKRGMSRTLLAGETGGFGGNTGATGKKTLLG